MVLIKREKVRHLDKEVVLRYVELALTNLTFNKQMKFNIEGEIAKIMNLYDEEQIKKEVEAISFNISYNN